MTILGLSLCLGYLGQQKFAYEREQGAIQLLRETIDNLNVQPRPDQITFAQEFA